MKKIISFAVAFVMLLSCFVISTSAGNEAMLDLVGMMSLIDSNDKGEGAAESTLLGVSSGLTSKIEDGAIVLPVDTSKNEGCPRALCKINGNDGVNISGYTYMYIDIEFDGIVTQTTDDKIRATFSLGDETKIYGTSVRKISDANGNELTDKYGTIRPSTHERPDDIAELHLPTTLGETFTLTYQVKILNKPSDNIVNRIHFYPGGWNAMVSGTFTVTSVRFGGDTDPGLSEPEIDDAVIANVGVQTKGGASLLDCITGIDAGVENIGGNTSQSDDHKDGKILFKGPQTSGGNSHPRSLCKINGDDGVDLTGYTYMYMDVEFDGVTPTNLFRTRVFIGDKSAVDQMSITKITDANGNEITYGTNSGTGGLNNYTDYPAPTNLGSKYTLTFRVKIPDARMNTTTNRMFIYPGGWEGINSGNMTVTSMRLGGDTDPGVEKSARFVSVLRDADLSKYSEVGFEVTAALGDVSNTQTVSGNTVYTSIVGAGDDYTPDLFGGNYFVALRIDNVPAIEGLTFTVRSYVKTVDGETIYAEAVTYTVAANGTIS